MPHGRIGISDPPRDSPASDRVLVAGKTCWRIERATRISVVIDAATYFAALKRALLAARHSVLMIGWDFDTRVELDREAPEPGVPNSLGPLLTDLVRRNPRLHVHVLRWDLAFLKMPLRGTTPFFLLDWLANRRLHFRLDSHHPAEACHHQKIVVIDDAVAFCGGIDVTIDRWDTRAHADDDPRRVRPDGSLHGPWHDVTTAVEGPAARALGELARDRWQAATGRRPAAPPPCAERWPDGLDAEFRDLDVAIARTEPAYGGRPEVREIEALYLAAIASARRTVYLESQYFSAHRIAAAIERRLAEPDGPEVVIVNPLAAEAWLDEEVMGSARALLLERLRRADRGDRLRFYTPVTAAGAPIYVHAKVLAIDDRLLRVGSSNINNRSLGVDTECDLAMQAGADRPDLCEAILRVRDSLLAEHLGIEREEFRRVLAEAGGSLVRTLDRLIRPSGKSLRPFNAPALSDAERALGESHALDPDRPENMATTFVRAVRVLPPRWLLAAALAGLSAAVVLAGRRRSA